MSSNSPTPSLESLSGTPIGSLVDSDPSRSTENSPPVTSGLLLGNGSSPSTICPRCSETFSNPRILNCMHTLCLSCADSQYDLRVGGIKCVVCNYVTDKHASLLLPDYAVQRFIEARIDELSCNTCKVKEGHFNKCLECNQIYCGSCTMNHSYIPDFQKHTVLQMSEFLKRDDRLLVACHKHATEFIRFFCMHCQEPMCAECALVDHPSPSHPHVGINEVVNCAQDQLNGTLETARVKAQELLAFAKNSENSSNRFAVNMSNAAKEIENSFQMHKKMLEDTNNQLTEELKALYNARQLVLSSIASSAQESVETIWCAVEAVDKVRKYTNPIEILQYRKMLERVVGEQVNRNKDNIQSANSVTDIEFVATPTAVAQNMKSSFGYIKLHPDSNAATKMAPIARPTSGVHHMNSLNSHMNGLSIGNGLTNGNSMSNGSNHLTAASINNYLQSIGGVSSNSNNLTNAMATAIATFGNQERMNSASMSTYGKRYHNSNGYSNVSAIGDMNFSNTTGFEKWSSGADSSSFPSTADSFPNMGGNSTPEYLGGEPKYNTNNGTNSYPPRSQIKRQKMIYHCKFGEFGVLEGQFTEPSGVAVNAQNDIIVADTNNHRIQIFDKEGRFKFQFGECGKRDGQLLYPNRVAVVRTSGDIIVTERSPTHQIQIYNQYGQFVRKFGANTLCYPRGVTVDYKGRIIVVECKVMRVIIFDQYGTVLNQFNCPNHLEFPNGVVVNEKQEIFISDNRAHCVKVFSYEGAFLRQIGGEGITNYPIGVGITTHGEVLIADNHNNFNLTLFQQDGTLVQAYESKVKHAQCFDVALMDDGSVVLASKDYRLYVYRYLQVPPVQM